ncbi:MAG: hypothetical protein AAB486_01140 [Patescibacteria group bacterium]
MPHFWHERTIFLPHPAQIFATARLVRPQLGQTAVGGNGAGAGAGFGSAGSGAGCCFGAGTAAGVAFWAPAERFPNQYTITIAPATANPANTPIIKTKPSISTSFFW